MNLADHLRLYCEIGAPVFPLTGKQPLIPNGFKGASTDPAQVVEWWQRWPDANVGVATGHAFDVLDIDSPEAMAELGADALTPHDQPIVTTGRGWHVYYAITGTDYGKATRVRSRMAGHAGIDWKGLGGYVVAPPSIHPDTGKRYTFNHWTEPVIAPDFVLEMLISECPSVAPQRPVEGPESGVGGPGGFWYPETQYAMMREAPEGERNDVLNTVSFFLGKDSRHAPSADAVLTAYNTLEAIAIERGLTPQEVTRTMRSGFNAGRREV